MKPILKTLLLALILTSSLCSLSQSAQEPSIDRQLISSLQEKDLAGARHALERGANPQAVLGNNLNDYAMCTAIDDRGTELLELLLEFGASVNFNRHAGGFKYRTPLSCAIFLYNPAAFDLLLEKGADPDANLCSECAKPEWRQSAFNIAVSMRRYPMVIKLIEISEIDEVEMQELIIDLELSTISYHPWADEREALVKWVQDQGIDFNPAVPSPPPAGYDPPECVHSVRDIEEELEIGTICE